MQISNMYTGEYLQWIKKKNNKWGSITKDNNFMIICADRSAWMAGLIKLPHILGYKFIWPRRIASVNRIFILFIVYFQTVSFNVTVTMTCATVDTWFTSHFGMWLLLPSQLSACGHCYEEHALTFPQRSHWTLIRQFNMLQFSVF